MAPETKDEEKPRLRRRCLERALRHPLRAQMHAELNKRPVGLVELADRLGGQLPVIAYHYRVLDALGALPKPDASET